MNQNDESWQALIIMIWNLWILIDEFGVFYHKTLREYHSHRVFVLLLSGNNVISPKASFGF